MPARFRRGLAAIFFVLDAADTAAWLVSVIPETATLDGRALSLVVARGLVASVEAIAAWLLTRNAPAARPLSIVAVIGAATLTTLIVGLGLAPSDVAPGVRIGVVTAYWLIAVVGTGLAWRQPRPFG
ncbi:MAG TPA: hypothetical protein VIX35_12445 [Vicinamibacterales bacterium]